MTMIEGTTLVKVTYQQQFRGHGRGIRLFARALWRVPNPRFTDPRYAGVRIVGAPSTAHVLVETSLLQCPGRALQNYAPYMQLGTCGDIAAGECVTSGEWLPDTPEVIAAWRRRVRASARVSSARLAESAQRRADFFDLLAQIGA